LIVGVGGVGGVGEGGEIADESFVGVPLRKGEDGIRDECDV
jgi:hypothetical protein